MKFGRCFVLFEGVHDAGRGLLPTSSAFDLPLYEQHWLRGSEQSRSGNLQLTADDLDRMETAIRERTLGFFSGVVLSLLRERHTSGRSLHSAGLQVSR
ncbi:hypothetical protein [Sinorhizobium psoraleae]|uniref:hypothetical protein n=1 Tax=Sinorhizobium psoraleae TaxID=520838 RepID=UPI001569060F|nr:hypothetical protein [Sinorhizobium psoraleae]